MACARLAVLLAVPVIAVAGCGSDGGGTTSPTMTAGTSGAQVEAGNTINYGSFGTTADLDCADGKSLNVGGADNKITFDKIDKELSVVGLNNTVTYKDGDPKVNNLGSGNDIKKA